MASLCAAFIATSPLVYAQGQASAAPVAQAKQSDALLPNHRVVYESLFAFRYNPLGIEEQLTVAYRKRLYDKPGILWRDAYVGAGFTPTLNPAVMRLGGTLEVKPLAVATLSAGFYYVNWFGVLGHLQTFPDVSAEHSDSVLDDREEAGQNQSAHGTELQLRAQLAAKAGPIVIRNDTNFFRQSLELRSDERLFYNVRTDVLAPNNGWSVTNDTDLVYLSDKGLIAGARLSVLHAFYRDADFPAGSSDNPNTPSVRLGPLFAYIFHDEPGTLFNRPTLLLLTGFWLAHRYRTGEDTSQAVPYVVLGFRCEGDLWSSR
jgi:hypothetical protein